MTQIAAVPPLPPTPAADKRVPEPVPPPTTWEPEPALRPTLQDIIDVDETLLAMRTLTQPT